MSFIPITYSYPPNGLNYKRAPSVPDNLWGWHIGTRGVKVFIIVASVVGLAILAVGTGCLFACCCQNRKRRQTKLERFEEKAQKFDRLDDRAERGQMDSRLTDGVASKSTQTGSGLGSQDSAVQDLASMGSLLASKAFDCRELKVYKKEKRLRQKAPARIRSSIDNPLPIRALDLERKQQRVSATAPPATRTSMDGNNKVPAIPMNTPMRTTEIDRSSQESILNTPAPMLQFEAHVPT